MLSKGRILLTPCCSWNALQQIRELVELGAVGALDEDIAAFGAVGGDGGLDFFYIVEKRATLPKLFVK